MSHKPYITHFTHFHCQEAQSLEIFPDLCGFEILLELLKGDDSTCAAARVVHVSGTGSGVAMLFFKGAPVAIRKTREYGIQ